MRVAVQSLDVILSRRTRAARMGGALIAGGRPWLYHRCRACASSGKTTGAACWIRRLSLPRCHSKAPRSHHPHCIYLASTYSHSAALARCSTLTAHRTSASPIDITENWELGRCACFAASLQSPFLAVTV